MLAEISRTADSNTATKMTNWMEMVGTVHFVSTMRLANQLQLLEHFQESKHSTNLWDFHQHCKVY